jgi:hypothetical protein
MPQPLQAWSRLTSQPSPSMLLLQSPQPAVQVYLQPAASHATSTRVLGLARHAAHRAPVEVVVQQQPPPVVTLLQLAAVVRPLHLLGGCCSLRRPVYMQQRLAGQLERVQVPSCVAKQLLY